MHLERLNFFLFFLHPCGTPTSLGLWLFPGGAMEGLKCTTSQLWEPAIHLQINPSDHLPKKPASLSCLPLLSKWPSICSAKPLKLILAPPLFFSLPTSNLPAMVVRCAFKFQRYPASDHFSLSPGSGPATGSWAETKKQAAEFQVSVSFTTPKGLLDLNG